MHHVCILTSYKGYQDLLEFKEEELILLQDEIQGLNDALMHSYWSSRKLQMTNQNKHDNRQGHKEEKEAFCRGLIEYLY